VDVTRWAEAINTLLERGNSKQVELARLLKMHPPVLNRYLRGERQPDQKTIVKIDRAVAKLIGRPDVAPYLDTEAVLCGLSDAAQHFADDDPPEGGELVLHADYSHDLDTLVRITLSLLDTSYGSLYMTGYREPVEAYMRASGDVKARRFAVALNSAFLKVRVAEVMPPPAPVGFILVLDVLRQHGISVELTEFGIFILAWEQFQWVVRRELALANPRAASRQRAASEKRIFDALRERFDLQPKAVGTRQADRRGHA
jgi:DNA-binding transcriptional regulator YdaS (Cro superfamily)